MQAFGYFLSMCGGNEGEARLVGLGNMLVAGHGVKLSIDSMAIDNFVEMNKYHFQIQKEPTRLVSLHLLCGQISLRLTFLHCVRVIAI